MIRKMSNKKTQGILMAAAMSFNLLNTVAIQMPKNFTADALLHNIKQNEAKPETYTAACCKALHFADGLFFGTAEAAKTQDVNSGENIEHLAGDFMSDVITAIRLDAQEVEDIDNGRNEINADPFRGIQLN